jgi:hypothetical protein
MTIAAMHTGQRVTFDDAKQDVVVGSGAASGRTTATQEPR